MKVEFKNRIPLFVWVVTVVTLQGCWGSGGLTTDNSRKEYNQDFEKMKKVVEQAVKASNMNINFVDNDGDEMVLTVGRDTYVGNEDVQQEQGKVRLIKQDEEVTSVQVENPDYHFSVPSHQKEDYQRIIFLRIDSILEQ